MLKDLRGFGAVVITSPYGSVVVGSSPTERGLDSKAPAIEFPHFLIIDFFDCYLIAKCY